MDDFQSLVQLTDDERDNATQKYKIIEPYINSEALLKTIAENKGISIRTLSSWIKNYHTYGLRGLVRQSRGDKGLPRQYDVMLQKTIEGIYLKKPMLSGGSKNLKLTDFKINTPRFLCSLLVLRLNTFNSWYI